jgi:signal transduction histidine kinase
MMRRGRGYHIFFGVALLTLAALGAWWTVFISQAVELERTARLESLRSAAMLTALSAGCRDLAPAPGPSSRDSRLEWVASTECEAGDLSAAALPNFPELSVRPLPQTLQALEHKKRRRHVMIIGEGTLLVLLLGVCTYMLYRLVRQERRNLRRMESFVSSVTHEMKTPLAGIKSMLQTLAAGRVPEPDKPHVFALGLKETERLQHSIENILVAGRLRTQHYRLQVEPVALREVLDAFLEHRRPALVDCPDAICLQWQLEGDEQHVLADPSALRIILENLTDNGLKYGGDDPTVTLRVRRDAGQVLVSVEDQGIGFVGERAEDLFTPFRRDLDNGKAVQHGTGLGLSIARALARRMGGEVVASSPGPGQGSTFTVVLREAELEHEA